MGFCLFSRVHSCCVSLTCAGKGRTRGRGGRGVGCQRVVRLQGMQQLLGTEASVCIRLLCALTGYHASPTPTPLLTAACAACPSHLSRLHLISVTTVTPHCCLPLPPPPTACCCKSPLPPKLYQSTHTAASHAVPHVSTHTHRLLLLLLLVCVLIHLLNLALLLTLLLLLGGGVGRMYTQAGRQQGQSGEDDTSLPTTAARSP